MWIIAAEFEVSCVLKSFRLLETMLGRGVLLVVRATHSRHTVSAVQCVSLHSCVLIVVGCIYMVWELEAARPRVSSGPAHEAHCLEPNPGLGHSSGNVGIAGVSTAGNGLLPRSYLRNPPIQPALHQVSDSLGSVVGSAVLRSGALNSHFRSLPQNCCSAVRHCLDT